MSGEARVSEASRFASEDGRVEGWKSGWVEDWKDEDWKNDKFGGRKATALHSTNLPIFHPSCVFGGICG
jgi:hypothetical protein